MRLPTNKNHVQYGTVELARDIAKNKLRCRKKRMPRSSLNIFLRNNNFRLKIK
jgi:hypothetical protein